MATTMSMAQSAVQVGIPPEKARRKWKEWTKEGGPGMGLKVGGKSEDVATGNLPEELQHAAAGTAVFEPGDKRRSQVGAQLRYNRDVLDKSGQGPDSGERRDSL